MDKSILTMTKGGDRQEAAGGLTPRSDGKEAAKRRKGSSDGAAEAAYSLRCTTGD